MSEPIFSDHPFAGWNAEVTKSTDDVSTFGTIPVVVTGRGCGGVRCADGVCSTCLADNATTVIAYVPPF
jgi:hypothetical protein